MRIAHKIFFLFIILTATACSNKWEEIEKRQFVLPFDPFRGYAPDSLKHLLPVLDSVLARDQRYRFLSLEKNNKIRNLAYEYVLKHKNDIIALDQENYRIVDSILNKYGWLSIVDVGMRGSNALFMVIQHAPYTTQERYLPMLQDAVKNKKLPGANYAILVDRIEASQKRPQLFGTQIIQASDTAYLFPLANVDSIDTWRKRIGISQTFASYLDFFKIHWDPEAYKKSLPQLRAKFRVKDSTGHSIEKVLL